MWKKFFAASAVAVGIAGILGSGSVFAASAPYTPGTVINPGLVTNVTICVDYSDKVISGESISAEVWGQNVSGRLEFEYENFVAYGPLCVLIPQSTFGMQGFRYIIPMGISGATLSNDGAGEYTLSLEDATVSNNYLRSHGSTTRRIKKSTFDIQFDANGGEGTMASMTNLIPNTYYQLTSNSFTRAGYVLTNWNTKADGTGDSYADKGWVNFATSETRVLYAQWVDYHGIASTLKEGEDFNAALVQLAGGANNIRSVEFVSSLPSTLPTSAIENRVLVSTNNSAPAYAYIDGDAVYIMAENDAHEVTMNYYSSSMFEGMTNLETVKMDQSVVVDALKDISKIFKNTALSTLTLPSGIGLDKAGSMSEAFYNTNMTDWTFFENWNVSEWGNTYKMFYHDNGVSMRYPSWYLQQHAGYLADGNTIRDKLSALGVPVYSSNGVVLKYKDELPSGFSPTSSNVISADGYSESVYIWKEDDGNGGYDYYYGGNKYIDAIVLNADSSGLFNALSISNIETRGDYFWETRFVTNMSNMFADDYVLESMDFAENWDTSSVTNMSHMFNWAIVLADASALENWDVSSVTDMSHMFNCAIVLADASALENWDVSSVTDMSNMFDNSAVTTPPSWYNE
ncbi:BspA family leucine-rich repeat surface protein [Candidatus Saccharibacteria bacterium]|nr:BspA family leucine-rich repeat surface protein [Candidatus Saccharibacteria bacterium]